MSDRLVAFLSSLQVRRPDGTVAAVELKPYQRLMLEAIQRGHRPVVLRAKPTHSLIAEMILTWQRSA